MSLVQDVSRPARSAPPRVNKVRLYGLEVRAETLTLLRSPMFLIPTIIFPLLFYVVFGFTYMNQSAGNVRVPMYMLATYGAFGVIGASLFSFGVGIANDRASGWLKIKRVSPMPPAAFLLSKFATSLMFNVTIISLMFLLGATIGKVEMPAETWLRLGATLILGGLPFTALGLALGFLSGPGAAPALANVIYIPMSFASGLWVPHSMLPEFFQKLAQYLPPYHFSQLALGQIGAATDPNMLTHILWLVGSTVLFLTLALIGYRRDEGNAGL
ncbi:ABC transporter permease [Deinococcus sp. HMF7620]|uniref:ABC transporter permease n=1 Tax=Deinococcus arboris TaxID=2682977 RepID=A0A7C9HR11_9DEIO|nr:MULTISPECIES: ABC transporter permease [Deinococcus]MBZ9751409.1 ABC transporter permease [Deinococcus betulae]MVN86632.1 ABC transporter permease [Deinococcus arboris]